MNISKLSTVFFSPTDSTKAVLETMTAGLSPQSAAIDLTNFSERDTALAFTSGELVFFGVPVYGGRVPAPMAASIKRLRGDHTPAVLVVTYGNREYDDALLELQALTVASGFIPVAAGAFVTEHSIMHSVARGRPDASDAKKIASFGKAAWDKVQNAADTTSFNALKLPGNVVYREYSGIPLKPKATKRCTACGVCATSCPVGAIPADSPRETDSAACISCMRCMKVCPAHARKLNGLMLFVAERSFRKNFSARKEPETFI